MHERNNRAIPEFEGYSPNEMTYILYWPFKENSPLEISPLEKHDYERIPMLKQIHYLAEILREQGEMKLTQKGFLPTKVVAELCQQEFLMNECLETRLERVKESDSMSATLNPLYNGVGWLNQKKK